MNKQIIEDLVEAATNTIAKYGDGENHTVASAVAAENGEIITGINLYHFTGGPCGEVVAMANAIGSGHKNLVAVVAVGDRGRGVLAPCGRCRQTLFDYYPDIQVVLVQDGEHITKSIQTLLPNTYDWHEQQN